MKLIITRKTKLFVLEKIHSLGWTGKNIANMRH